MRGISYTHCVQTSNASLYNAAQCTRFYWRAKYQPAETWIITIITKFMDLRMLYILVARRNLHFIEPEIMKYTWKAYLDLERSKNDNFSMESGGGFAKGCVRGNGSFRIFWVFDSLDLHVYRFISKQIRLRNRNKREKQRDQSVPKRKSVVVFACVGRAQKITRNKHGLEHTYT